MSIWRISHKTWKYLGIGLNYLVILSLLPCDSVVEFHNGIHVMFHVSSFFFTAIAITLPCEAWKKVDTDEYLTNFFNYGYRIEVENNKHKHYIFPETKINIKVRGTNKYNCSQWVNEVRKTKKVIDIFSWSSFILTEDPYRKQTSNFKIYTFT